MHTSIRYLILLALAFVGLSSFANNTNKFEIINNNVSPCSGEPFQLSATGNGDYTYQWYPKELFSSNNIQVVNCTALKSCNVFAIRTNKNNGLKDTAFTWIEIEEETISVLGKTVLCNGEEGILKTARAINNPVWNGKFKTNELSIKQGGVYRIEGSDNCKFVHGEIHVKTKNTPIAVIMAEDDLTVCKGEKAKLKAFGNYTNFKWSTGEKTTEIFAEGGQKILLSIKNECGEATDVKEIVLEEIDANFIPGKLDGIVPFNLRLFNESKLSGTNQWFVNGELVSTESEPVYTINNEGEYEITLERTSPHGCKEKMSYGSIIGLAPVSPVIKSDELILVPNAFTPNGDGLNDELEIISNLITEVEFTVFDRWGKEIFHSNGSWTWNGDMDNGSSAPQGMYVIQYVYKDLEGKQITKTQELTVIR